MWYYQDKELKDDSPHIEEQFGFVYKITLKKDIDIYKKGTIYIGKKQLSFSRKTKISKKERLETGNNRKKFKQIVKDSGWKDYYGSNFTIKELIETHGEGIFKREILEFYPSKYKLSFGEIEHMILNEVHKRNSFNGTIGRFFISKLK